ncbi:hypothetical protein [Nitrincola nitratireducens]|uniref:Phasin protein n=1 Tax=Nitrincola nitratireducens TaxID=1229521 RepID=W9UYT1_9GAMM|nr:hypothetical protein [Nitrincola nitratireducens]EXJ09846.1 hypothetical protein D791_03174 [Nitrincola nitratireducens]
MTNTVDFQKPVEAVKSLIALQTETLTKTVELQKKAGEDLVAFFKAEAEKAKTLKTPEDLIKFNTEANTSLFNLLKSQGEASLHLQLSLARLSLLKFKASASKNYVDLLS